MPSIYKYSRYHISIVNSMPLLQAAADRQRTPRISLHVGGMVTFDAVRNLGRIVAAKSASRISGGLGGSSGGSLPSTCPNQHHHQPPTSPSA